MRFLSALTLVLCLVPASWAQTNNQLNQDQVRRGWILLFDGRTTFGWKAFGTVAVKDGALVVGGDGKQTLCQFQTTMPASQLVFEYKTEGDGVNAVVVKGEQNATFAKLNSKQWIAKTINCDKPRQAIEIISDGKGKVAIRNMKLRFTNTTSLFNGKNLEGWKVLPGYKSEYTVTKEGWLNVKDGRGDIQTVAKFKNFSLQLECFSNGKHLNSGIFFRCIPDQYQQGYEAQIRNEFTPNETREYKVEIYDPKTHNKTGVEIVKSTAIDYGTGGIYRRVPARMGNSQDKEWFTMTVIADGNHFATWVNGVQMVNWFDHRPLADNGRKGCCLNSGVISIQGHDPTTDLSFRNFRIATLPD